MVVNYDVPHDNEDYVHRIGRTARANADGVAVTLVSDRDRRKFAQIEQFLGYQVRREELPAGLGDAPSATLPSVGGKPEGKRRGRGGRNRNVNAGKDKESGRGRRREGGRRRGNKGPRPSQTEGSSTGQEA